MSEQFGIDIPSGVIIGALKSPYEFWARDGKRFHAKGYFEDDESAVEWFRERYPVEFAAGADMRVFDCTPKRGES